MSAERKYSREAALSLVRNITELHTVTHSPLSRTEAGSFWRTEVMKRPEVVCVPQPAVTHCAPGAGDCEVRLTTSTIFFTSLQGATAATQTWTKSVSSIGLFNFKSAMSLLWGV